MKVILKMDGTMERIKKYANGDVYEGEWKDGKPNEGTLKYPSGCVYEGEFKREKEKKESLDSVPQDKRHKSYENNEIIIID